MPVVLEGKERYLQIFYNKLIFKVSVVCFKKESFATRAPHAGQNWPILLKLYLQSAAMCPFLKIAKSGKSLQSNIMYTVQYNKYPLTGQIPATCTVNVLCSMYNVQCTCIMYNV